MAQHAPFVALYRSPSGTISVKFRDLGFDYNDQITVHQSLLASIMHYKPGSGPTYQIARDRRSRYSKTS
jgi:hypothetical protein